MGKFKKFLGIVALMALLVVSVIGVSVTTLADGQPAPVYTAEGWTEYGGESVSATNGGIAMKSGGAGYYFSNTSQKAYQTAELAVSFRLKDYFCGATASSIFVVGLTATDEDIMSESGSSYGVALVGHTDNRTFNAWFVRRDASANGIPGWANLALVGGNNAYLTDTGVVTISFHREPNGQWYIWVNGIYQIQVPAEGNAAFDAQTQSHVAIVGTDYLNVNSKQTATVEVFSVGGDVLGSANANHAITNSIGSSTAQTTEDGVVFSTNDKSATIGVRAGVRDNLVGKLDGAVISVKREVTNATGYNLDFGVGTWHGNTRYDFWQSAGDYSGAGIIGSFGIRIQPNNAITFLMITRTATEGCDTAEYRCITPNGAAPAPVGEANEYVVQFLKINGNWYVIINCRWIYCDSNVYPYFQAALNRTLDSLNGANGELVSPWWMLGDITGQTDGYEAKVTVNGYGANRWVAATEHDYATINYAWAEDNSAVTAIAFCKNDPTNLHAIVEENVATEANIVQPQTCENEELTSYTATFSDPVFTTQTKENIKTKDAKGHAYGEASYEWNADNTACTATRVCYNDANHVETATATVTSQTTDATCTESGATVYTATFEEDWAATQTKTAEETPALNHAYGEVTYTWNAENTACTATRVCGNDETHVETANATVTSEVTEESTCAVAGETVYTATFAEAWATTQTKVEKLPKEEHTFGEWEVVDKATIHEEGLKKQTCQECGETIEEVIPKIEYNSEDVIDVSCGGAMGGTTAAFVAVMGVATLAIRRKRR